MVRRRTHHGPLAWFGMSHAGTEYMLTAAHGVSGNGVTVRDGAGGAIGTTTSIDYSLDSVQIRTNVGGRMYDGSSTSSSTEAIKGGVRPENGLYVCTSDSYTRANCNIKVTNSRYRYILDSQPRTSIHGDTAVGQTSGGRANGKGNSGGPVLVNTSVAREIKVTGIVSALNDGESRAAALTRRMLARRHLCPHPDRGAVSRDRGDGVGVTGCVR